MMKREFRNIAGLAVLSFLFFLVHAGFGNAAPAVKAAKPPMPYPVSPGAFAKPGPALDRNWPGILFPGRNTTPSR
jgi:hypothetical protein